MTAPQPGPVRGGLVKWKVMSRLPKVSGRILIVDDDERQRNALAAMLSDGDFDTQLAADG